MEIGDRLSAIIASDRVVNILTDTRDRGCGSCLSMKEQMNKWGITGCEKYRQLIVNHLVEQAIKRLLLVSSLCPTAIERRAEKWVDKAIAQQKAAERDVAIVRDLRRGGR
jgi:hypothetical protein